MTKLTAAQQDLIAKMKAGAVLTSTDGLGSHSGAEIQFPGQMAETVRYSTVRALYSAGALRRVKDGYTSTWLLA
jgi:hypothetical protein